jgi:hypothetical protein
MSCDAVSISHGITKGTSTRAIIVIQTAWRFINRITFVFEGMNSSRSDTILVTRGRKRLETIEKQIKELGLLIVPYRIKPLRYTQNIIYFKGSVKMKKTGLISLLKNRDAIVRF